MKARRHDLAALIHLRPAGRMRAQRRQTHTPRRDNTAARIMHGQPRRDADAASGHDGYRPGAGSFGNTPRHAAIHHPTIWRPPLGIRIVRRPLQIGTAVTNTKGGIRCAIPPYAGLGPSAAVQVTFLRTGKPAVKIAAASSRSQLATYLPTKLSSCASNESGTE